jgi:hypothetical protein
MKLRTTHSTIPYLLEEVEIELHAGGAHIGNAIQKEIPVTVDFSYTPGYPARITADPFDSEPGCDPEIEVNAVLPTLQAFLEVTDEDRPAGAALVLDAGMCIKYLLTKEQIEAIETAIDSYMTEGVEP